METTLENRKHPHKPVDRGVDRRDVHSGFGLRRTPCRLQGEAGCAERQNAGKKPWRDGWVWGSVAEHEIKSNPSIRPRGEGRSSAGALPPAACGLQIRQSLLRSASKGASRGGIARELRRARNRGRRRAKAAARGATLGPFLPVIELRRSAKELKRQAQCGCSMERNAGSGGSLCVPQIIELFCLGQGQKRMTFNYESNFIYCKIF